MNILEQLEQQQIESSAPLAERMKPRKLEDFVGQKKVIGTKSPLYNMIRRSVLMSMILYGPSGSGKTSIANIISKMTNYKFITVNAVTSGIADLKSAVTEAKNNMHTSNKTILFIDEVHRFNKSQQDFLLPYVENGTFILIGATTENPYFEINPALMSRCVLYTLKRLEEKDIINILEKAIKDEINGLGKIINYISDESVEAIANLSSGDARNALNILEIITYSVLPTETGEINIDIEDVKNYSVERKIIYDKNRDEHYNVISAFIKSIRGSDANAGLHYLARMLDGGEDIMFIVRRLVILASEDIGNANPMAAVLASSIANSVKLVGMPEARILLSQLVVFLSKSKKSNNDYLAINKAMADVKNKNCGDVPSHLKDGHYKGSKKLGHGIGYKYPHDYPQNWVKQEYLPDELIGTEYVK